MYFSHRNCLCVTRSAISMRFESKGISSKGVVMLVEISMMKDEQAFELFRPIKFLERLCDVIVKTYWVIVTPQDKRSLEYEYLLSYDLSLQSYACLALTSLPPLNGTRNYISSVFRRLSRRN